MLLPGGGGGGGALKAEVLNRAGTEREGEYERGEYERGMNTLSLGGGRGSMRGG